MAKPVRIKAPFQETFYFDDIDTDAYGYQFSIKKGQKTSISVNQLRGDSGLVFMDLFQLVADTLQPHRHIASSDTITNRIIVEHEVAGDYFWYIQSKDTGRAFVGISSKWW